MAELGFSGYGPVEAVGSYMGQECSLEARFSVIGLSNFAAHVQPGLSRFFYFRFLQKKIYFRFGNLQNISRPPRCRAAGSWPLGSEAAGAFLKKNYGQNCAQVPRGRSLGRGAAGPPSRLQGWYKQVRQGGRGIFL